MGVNLHWISSNWRLNHIGLSFLPLEGSHTGENLWELFIDNLHLNFN